MNQLVKMAAMKALFAAILAGALGVVAPPLSAQGEGESSVDGSAPKPVVVLTLDEVSDRLAAMELDAKIKDAVKEVLRVKYEQATDALKRSAENHVQADSYREAQKSAPAATKVLLGEIAALPEAGAAQELKPTGKIRDIQKELDSRKAEYSELKAQLASDQHDLALLGGRPVAISTRVPAAQLELAGVEAKLQSPVDSADDPTPSQVADQTWLEARKSELQSELAMLNQEQLSQLARRNLLQAQVDLLSRQVADADESLDSLSAWVNQRLTKEAEQVRSRAATAPGEIMVSDDAARGLAAEVRELAQDFEDVVVDLGETTVAHDRVVSRLDVLTEEFEAIRDQLEVGHGGVTMAQILFELRSRLPSRGSIGVNLKERHREMEEDSLARFKLMGKLREQASIEKKFGNHSSEAVRGLVATRVEILTKLKDQYGTLIRAQAALLSDERLYLDKVDEARVFVEEQLFWRRSSPPISSATFASTLAGLLWLNSADHWLELWDMMVARFQRSPFESWAWVAILAGLVFARPRLGAALERLVPKIRRVSTDRYRYTAEALLWTCLLALPVPLFLGYIDWVIVEMPNPSSWLRGVQKGLAACVYFTLGVGILAAVCRKDGLGIGHFGWPEKPVVMLRRFLLMASVVYVPAMIVASSSLFGEGSAYFDGAGRMCFIVAHLWVAFLTWRLLRFSDGMISDIIREEPTALIVRTRYLWSALVLGIPLFIVLISALGYFLTGLEIGVGFLAALGAVGLGVILYWLVLRWFMVKERKLALAEAIERRRARIEAADSDDQDTDSGDMLTLDAVDEKHALRSISQQTRHLLQFMFGVGVTVVIAMLWSKFLPIFSALGVVAAPGGLTVLDWFKALMILLVTLTAARNLPGLLELAVLRTTSMESGTRNSISTLFQYAVMTIGLMAFFGTLQVDWAKLGWIAAALSVGLGFGLQEVVSNFVCGLILLFEQPIRVGDVVTVDGMNGKVAKIRMRATTIINWDRQEFVVPNKNIITGTLLNWSLTSPISRVIVSVGVAYGSNTGRAMQIMEEAANESAYVIEDPAPLATFEEFADSCLTLKLRAYLPNIDNRVQAVSELHCEIDRRFKEADIEISFPQRDLHLRSAGDWISQVGLPAAKSQGDDHQQSGKH